MPKLKIPIIVIRAILLIVFFIGSHSARANEEIFMLFLQPGGEGSTEEAQPLLNDFFSRIKELGGPTLTGLYSNDLAEGLSLLKQKKVGLTILGPDILEHALSAIPYTRILSTLPQGTGETHEKYFLLTKSGFKTNDMGTIWTSREFLGDFVTQTILKGIHPDLNPEVKIAATRAPLGTLKKIAAHSLADAVILDSYEYQSFKRLKMDALKDIVPLFQSPEVPAASVVLTGIKSESLQKSIVDAFLKISTDAKGKEILSNLRLKGFKQL